MVEIVHGDKTPSGVLRDEAFFLRVAPQHIESDNVTRCIAQVIFVDEVKRQEELSLLDDHEKPERHGAGHRALLDWNEILFLEHRVLLPSRIVEGPEARPADRQGGYYTGDCRSARDRGVQRHAAKE